MRGVALACLLLASARAAISENDGRRADQSPAAVASPETVRPPRPVAVPVDFPIFELSLSGAFKDLTVAARLEDGSLRPLFDAALYGGASEEPGNHVLRARIDRLPWSIEVRDAPADWKARVVLPDGTSLPLRTAAPLSIPRETAARIDAALKTRKLPAIRTGIYYPTYPINDPSMVPSRAWVMQPRPEVVAAYDFSLLQGHDFRRKTPDRSFCAEVRRLNPSHRIILRLPPVAGAIPKYFSDAIYRAGLVEHYFEFIETAGPEHLHAVTIGEEENGNFLQGLYWTSSPPDWVAAFRQPFERETGKTLTWRNAACGNEQFRDWLEPQIRFFYNDLYDRLKARHPGLRVLQYLSLAGDGSGIAWHEPTEIKADGWIDWGFAGHEEPMLVLAQAGGVSFPVAMTLDASTKHLARIRDSGLPEDEIYYCDFAHHAEGKYPAVVDQVRRLQDLGYRNIFHFVPTGGLLQKEDCSDPAKVGELEREPYRTWQARRRAVLEHRRGM